MRLFHVLATLVIAIALAAPGRAATLISDGTFNDSDWTVIKANDSTPSGDAIAPSSQSLAGGNPGAYRHITHDWQVVPSGVSVTFAHLFSPLVFTPATLGEITQLSVSFDAFCDFAPIVNAIGFGPIIEQDGIYYVHAAGAAAIVGLGWTSFSFNNLTAVDFIDYYNTGLAHPDFSTSGSALRLGFWSGNGGSGFNDPNHIATGGVDNFLLTANITPVPEPATIALLLLPAAAFLRRTR